MKVILVPVAYRRECRIALNQAFFLADRLHANVVGCHLRPHRARELGFRREPFKLRVRRAPIKVDDKAEKIVEIQSHDAKALFEQLAAEHGFSIVKRVRSGVSHAALWSQMVGALEKLFSILGPISDLSVVSRPRPGAHGHGPEFLLSALLHSGKPVLVLPQARMRRPGKRVLIAWNQSKEAALAVSAALPILKRAEAVHICSCGRENQTGPKATNLSQYLNFWGVKTKRIQTKGRDVAEEIDDVFESTESDLIVMGAYSRSRMSELIFGGATRELLVGGTRPILALHS